MKVLMLKPWSSVEKDGGETIWGLNEQTWNRLGSACYFKSMTINANGKPVGSLHVKPISGCDNNGDLWGLDASFFEYVEVESLQFIPFGKDDVALQVETLEGTCIYQNILWGLIKC